MAVEFVGEVSAEKVPERRRSGNDKWAKYHREYFEANPGKTYEFKGVSSSTASNLRKRFGVDAWTQKEDGVVHMFVTYDPAKVDEIKAEFANRKSGNKGSGNGAAASSTPAQTPKAGASK